MADLKKYVTDAQALETRLSTLSHKIYFQINGGGPSEEYGEVNDIWYSVKQVAQDLVFVNHAIDTAEKDIEAGDVPESVKELLRGRLETNKEKAKKLISKFLRLETKANAVIEKFKNLKPKEEPKKDPEKPKPQPAKKESRPKPPPKINSIVSQRTELIEKLFGQLENKVIDAQRDLLKTVISDFLDGMEQDEAGNIKNTMANKRRFGMFDQVFNRFAKTKGLEVVQGLAEGVGRIVDFNQKYYSAFSTPAILAPIQDHVKETLGAWLGLTDRGKVEANGYLDTLVKDSTIKNQIKNLSLKSVISQAGYQETKKNLQTFIEGNKEQTGALQRYYRNYAYDLYSVADRTNAQIYADKLKFNYAIYEGGLVEKSRIFCIKRNGKVFSREEIADWMPTEAVPPNYNPFTDLGGYGCRHHLNWVPDVVAFAMRPDLKPK